MSALLESILNGDYVSANDLFEQKMSELQEKKLVESKKQIQAEMFGMTRAEIEAKKKAGYRKAADVLGDPRDIKISVKKKDDNKKKKSVKEETLDELTAGDVAKGVGYAAGKAIRAGVRTGGDVAYRLKRAYRLVRMKRHQAQSQKPTDDQDLRKTFGVERPEDKKRPGIVQRNINTLMGRQAGDTPEPTKPENRGGRVGKVARRVGIGLSAALQAAQPE